MAKLQCPEFYATRAREMQAQNQWLEAGAEWHKAATASAGHKRKARYYDAAAACVEQDTSLKRRWQAEVLYRDEGPAVQGFDTPAAAERWAERECKWEGTKGAMVLDTETGKTEYFTGDFWHGND